MPALSVSVDGISIATVCMDGYDVVSVSVQGTRIDENLAHLEFSGGSHPENDESTHLTWISDLPLRAGQVVTVSFLENAVSSHAGKTIEELFPDEPAITQTDFRPTTEMFEELRVRPKLREKFAFRVVSSSGRVYSGRTKPDEHGFGFGVLWNSFHSERARASLHSYTLDSLEAREPFDYHFEERMKFGDSIQFELLADVVLE